mmetsp:Transcript_33019/g.70391  ORF Transcript_33019/g.70391 Transcript_33019/m.70391 type:complete len:133 (-) Transcript_33019:61-459(-)
MTSHSVTRDEGVSGTTLSGYKGGDMALKVAPAEGMALLLSVGVEGVVAASDRARAAVAAAMASPNEVGAAGGGGAMSLAGGMVSPAGSAAGCTAGATIGAAECAITSAAGILFSLGTLSLGGGTGTAAATTF